MKKYFLKSFILLSAILVLTLGFGLTKSFAQPIDGSLQLIISTTPPPTPPQPLLTSTDTTPTAILHFTSPTTNDGLNSVTIPVNPTTGSGSMTVKLQPGTYSGAVSLQGISEKSTISSSGERLENFTITAGKEKTFVIFTEPKAPVGLGWRGESSCGNKICEWGENCGNCVDCWCSVRGDKCINNACLYTPPPQPPKCGNQLCEKGENCGNCWDCSCDSLRGFTCDDGVCAVGNPKINCNSNVGASCIYNWPNDTICPIGQPLCIIKETFYNGCPRGQSPIHSSDCSDPNYKCCISKTCEVTDGVCIMSSSGSCPIDYMSGKGSCIAVGQTIYACCEKYKPPQLIIHIFRLGSCLDEEKAREHISEHLKYNFIQSSYVTLMLSQGGGGGGQSPGQICTPYGKRFVCVW